MVALGAAKAKMNELDEAEHWLKKALHVDAETPNAAKYLAKVLDKQQKQKQQACDALCPVSGVGCEADLGVLCDRTDAHPPASSETK